MPEVIIIADDLTGAADCGIAFTEAGLPTVVAFGMEPVSKAARVVAVDTDSRALSPEAAGERAHGAARRAYGLSPRTVYRKIDSTLRGNVGTEVAATLRAAVEVHGRALVIVSPAFPGAGRTVRAGRVRVHGVPLEETEVWLESGRSGPAGPAEMLARAGLKVANVSRGEVRAGALPERDVEALVCDAETDEDLARIARAGAALPGEVVWAGSAGLARHLPAALGLRAAEPATPAAPWAKGPVLALVGSRSSIAREQARHLLDEPGLEAFTLDPRMLAEGERGAGWKQAEAGLQRALDAGRDVLLCIAAGESAPAPLVAAALGRLAAAQAGRIGGVIATGGDIARAVLVTMGASGMSLLGAVEPGVPLGLTDTPRALRAIVKAGAFGDAQTLNRCLAALKR